MSDKATQAKRCAAIDTPLGTDVLLLRGFSLREHMSQPYQVDAELLSENGAIRFDSIIGKNVTLRLDIADGAKRYFHGVVSSFAQLASDGRYFTYHATIVPTFWLLGLRKRCRIFQNTKAPEILKKILSEGDVQVDDRLHGNYEDLEYCVQYRETDLDFCNRLMEQEGIYYFFKHENDKHTMVLCDSVGAHEPFPGHATIEFRPHGIQSIAGKFVHEWSMRKSVLSNRYSHTDFDFEKPKYDLFQGQQSSKQKSGQVNEVYDYPGTYTESERGERLAKVRMGEIDVQHETRNGASDCPGIAVGHRFQLGRCPTVNFPREEDYKEYLVISALHSVRVCDYETESNGDEWPYQCTFSVISHGDQFRPPRLTPKPRMEGPQTAIVVGPSGDEIHTDKYGRVKVQFHWDRDGKRDEKSSCFIRVAQAWAGKNWGAIMIPRIGQEVVVEFLEGDPDQPIITGSVYNADTTPPFPLASKAAISGVKTNSTKGGGGFNEFTMDDTKGSEKIVLHAQRDMESKIEHDRKTIVVNDDSLRITTGNQTIKIDVGKSQTEAMQSIELKVGQSKIRIDQTGVTVEGMVIKVNGQAQTRIESPMTEVNGSGMLKLQGGITMIN